MKYLNIASNLAYVIAGIAVWGVAWYVGLSLILLGVASAWFHTTYTRTANAADIIGIYLTFNSIIAFLLSNYEINLMTLLIGVILITFVMGMYEGKMNSSIIIPVQFTIVCMLAWSQVPMYAPIFLAALLLNIPHLKMEDKAPHWFIEATHGVWHILTALGIYKIIETFI